MQVDRFLVIAHDVSNNANGYNHNALHSSPCHLTLPSLPPSVTTLSVSVISETYSEGNSSQAESDFCALFDQKSEQTDFDEKSEYKIKIEPILLPKLAHSGPVSEIAPSTLSSTLSDSDNESLYEQNEISGGNIMSCTESPSIITSLKSPSINTDISGIISPVSGYHANIEFDIASGQHSISSKGLETGYHEWTVKVIDCDIFRQEIGIISNIAESMGDKENLSIANNSKYGARAVYGSIIETKTFYYSSYNNDNSCRCKKDLSSLSSWWKNDTITVCADLNKGMIWFLLNGKKVRKSISVQRGVVYYPIISFNGDCKYQLV